MRTDGQTDMTKLMITFRNFENAPKTQTIKIHKHGTRKKQNKKIASRKRAM